MSARCVAHLDMDAFYVSVELLRRPELRGLPVIVAGRGPRAVVTTASYEARQFGVGSAMPASQALRRCPQAVVLEPDFAFYRDVSREVMGIVRGHVELVEVVGLDEAYLELTGLPAPHATMRTVATFVRARTGLRCSVGIGPNKLVAKVASDAEKPGGFVVLSHEQARRRFAGESPGLVPGIGPKTVERLRAIGLDTIAKLAAASPRQLAGHFGPRHGTELQRRARFEDDAPVSELRKVVSESREVTFDRDIAELHELERVLQGLVERLCAALVNQRRAGRTIGIKVRLDDFSTRTRSRTVAAALCTSEHVEPIARELLRQFGVPRPVRLLGVRVAGLEPLEVGQLALAV